MKIKVKHYETNEVEIFTLKQMLYEINRDRSDDFQPYDETDWEEGLSLTDYELVEVINEKN